MSHDDEKVARMAVRACRIAFRNIAPVEDDYMKEVARRIQEVWEEEGVDLTSLATWGQHSSDADYEMRAVYRERKGLPEEVLCEYCGEHVETLKATEGKYCNAECAALSADFRRRHPNG